MFRMENKRKYATMILFGRHLIITVENIPSEKST